MAAKESASIVSLRIKNFLSITDVEIKPGQVNQIVGKNNQGKTTVLKALQFAVKGGNDPALVKHGEATAEVVVELSDSTVIKRKVTSTGKGSVDVRRDGFAAPQPQSFLDALFDGTTFNPLSLLDPKKRTEAILQSIELVADPVALRKELGLEEGEELPPVEFSQHGLKVLEQVHCFYYQRRAEANREAEAKAKRHEVHAEQLKAVEQPEHVNLEELAATEAEVNGAIATARADIAACKDAQTHAEAQAHALRQREQRVKELEAQAAASQHEHNQAIRRAEEELNRLKARLTTQAAVIEAGLNSAHAEVETARARIVAPHAPVGEFVEALHDAELRMAEVNRQKEVAANGKRYEAQKEAVSALEQEAAQAAQFAHELDTRVRMLAGPLKQALMESAEMPVKGLTYENGEFLVEGVPVGDLSSSKALALAVGVARKLAKRTKMICIDGAEALDAEAYAALRKEIDKDGYTYFLTKVGPAFEATDLRQVDQVIEMENGGVKA